MQIQQRKLYDPTNGNESLPAFSPDKALRDWVTANSGSGNIYSVSGADATGVLDASSYIQAAIDLAEADAKLATVKLPSGTYLVGSPLIINGDNVQLDLTGSIINLEDGVNDTVIAVYGCDNVTIIGGTINCNGSNQTRSDNVNLPNGITASGVTRFAVTRVTVNDAALQGIMISSYISASASVMHGNANQCQEIIVNACRLINIQNGAIIFSGGGSGTTDTRRGLITNNYISVAVDNPDGGTDAINVIDGAREVIVSNNYIVTNGSAGIVLEAHDRTGVRDMEDITISTNIVHLNGASGGYCFGADHSNNVIRQVTVTGNCFYRDGQNGACIDLSENNSQLENWAISGNSLRCSTEASSGSMGIDINRSSSGGSLDNIIFTGNSISGGAYAMRINTVPSKASITFTNSTIHNCSRIIRAEDITNLILSDLVIRESGSAGNGGIYIRDCSDVIAKNINFIDNAGNQLFYLEDSDGVVIDNVKANAASTSPITVKDCNSLKVSNCDLNLTGSGNAIIVTCDDDVNKLLFDRNTTNTDAANGRLLNIVVNGSCDDVIVAENRITGTATLLFSLPSSITNLVKYGNTGDLLPELNKSITISNTSGSNLDTNLDSGDFQPAGYYINSIFVTRTSGTGTINIGTASGGSQIVSSVATAEGLLTLVSNNYTSANDDIFVRVSANTTYAITFNLKKHL